jgi:single-stranded DNA-binding protein
MQKNIYVGTIGKDAIIQVVGDKNYAKFSIAVNDGKDSNDNKKTLWVDVLKFDKDGNLTPYLKKGNIVSVEGKITLSAYNKDNEPTPKMTLWANELNFVYSPKRVDKNEDIDDLPDGF